MRLNDVAERFAHFAPAFIYGEAVGEQAFVGRMAVNGAAGEQRGVEPAAVLVAAFEVEVGGIADVVALAQDGVVGGAGVEPDVEDVVQFFVVDEVGGRDEIFQRQGEPCFDAVFFDDGGGFVHDVEDVRVQFARFFVLDEAERHAPVALAGDAPIGAVGNHVGEAAASPFGGEAHVLQAIQRGLAQAGFVHADEPLRGGAVDGRAVVAPAVRVAVADGFVVDEAVLVAQELHDFGVGFEDVFAGEVRGVAAEGAVGQDGVQHVNAVLAADFKVFDAVRRRGVNAAGTGIQRDVFAVDEERVARDEGMGEDEAVKRDAFGGGVYGPRRADAPALAHAVHHFLGDDEPASFAFDEGVIVFGVDADGEVGGQGPRCGRPDDDVHRGRHNVAAHAPRQFRRVAHGKADVNGIGGFVFVFDFRFGKRGAAVQTPVHRLVTAHHMAAGNDVAQGADDARFGLRLHGEIGMRPVAKDAKADEIGFLQFDLARRISAAGGAEFGGADFGARFADLLLHFLLNRQAVAVPAGNVGAVKAEQMAGFSDDIFQDFVKRMADVNGTVGIGRAVVQDEFRRISEGGALFAVNIGLFPEGQHLRLTLRQIAAHRKSGFGKVQRIFIVCHEGVPD